MTPVNLLLSILPAGACAVVVGALAGTARAAGEGVEILEPASDSYCAALPTDNGGNRNLQFVAGQFDGAACGKYVVSCGDEALDDKRFFAAVVPPAVAPARGTILSFSGESGDQFHAENVREYADANFRVVLIAYESLEQPDGRYEAWQCARSECPSYADVDEPGPKESACRPAEIIAYFKKRFDPRDRLPYCAQGHSAGSSQIAYALTHYDADDYLDYVQLTGWTPFARPDYGCDPDRQDPDGLRNYWGLNPDGRLQRLIGRPFAYDMTATFARVLMERSFGLAPGECGAHPQPGVSDESFARLGNGAIVSSGAEYSYPDTVLDFYACASDDSMVDGNGAWYLDEVRDANPGRVFMQTLLAGTGDPANCADEEVWWMSDRVTPSPIRQLTIDRMISSCRVMD